MCVYIFGEGYITNKQEVTKWKLMFEQWNEQNASRILILTESSFGDKIVTKIVWQKKSTQNLVYLGTLAVSMTTKTLCQNLIILLLNNETKTYFSSQVILPKLLEIYNFEMHGRNLRQICMLKAIFTASNFSKIWKLKHLMNALLTLAQIDWFEPLRTFFSPRT
jgi:hypothetical protein